MMVRIRKIFPYIILCESHKTHRVYASTDECKQYNSTNDEYTENFTYAYALLCIYVLIIS